MIVYPGIVIWNAPISGNNAEYSSPSLAPLLASASRLLIQARTAQGSGTNPTLTVDIERSNDGLNYASVGANAPISNLTVSTSGVTNAFAQWDTTASDNLFGCFVRLKISLGGTTPSANIRVTVTGRSKRPRGVGKAAPQIAADARTATIAVAGGNACGCNGGKGCGPGRRQPIADPDPRFGPTPPPPSQRQRLVAGLSLPLGYGFRPQRRCPLGVIPSPDCFRYFPVSEECPSRCSYFGFGSGCCILEGADGRSFGFCARPGECSFQCGVQFSDPADVMHCYNHYRFDPGVVLCDDIC